MKCKIYFYICNLQNLLVGRTEVDRIDVMYDLAASYMKEYRKLYTDHIASEPLICNKRLSGLTRADLIRFPREIGTETRSAVCLWKSL